MDDVLKSKYEEAIWIAKALFQHRIITGTTGNISFLHNKKMYITKSGSCLGKLDMDSFAITDLNGNILFNKPSKEYIMHLALYNSNEIIYAFLTIFLYLLKCPQSLILSALRAFCFCGKPHISRSIFLYFRYQAWLKSW